MNVSKDAPLYSHSWHNIFSWEERHDSKSTSSSRSIPQRVSLSPWALGYSHDRNPDVPTDSVFTQTEFQPLSFPYPLHCTGGLNSGNNHSSKEVPVFPPRQSAALASSFLQVDSWFQEGCRSSPIITSVFHTRARS